MVKLPATLVGAGMLSLNYEYKVVPAPRRAVKSKAAGNAEQRFALSLSIVMNDMGREGWEYVRTDTLPMDERAGLTGGVKTTYLNMLVFRRVIVRETQTYDAENDDFDGADE
ncbi:MAG: DUF4177 domain-containing protein [Cypionkella sp.]|nr:DUF4177 domain-containing protein [Cypionkella sp.]